MLITASWEGADVPVELDETCVSFAALKTLLQAALPGMDVEKACLKVGGRSVDGDDDVLALVEGCVVAVSLLPAVQAKNTLLREGYAADGSTVARAIADGNVRLFQLCLDAGVPPDASALSKACRTKHIAFCKFLIDCGFDVNENEFATPPLHIAASTGNSELCKLLLDCGADVEVVGWKGDSPLQTAIESRTNKTLQMDVCKLLIDRGCDIRRQADCRPLATAIRCHNFEACKLLLDSGCGFGEEEEQRESTLLYLAIAHDEDDFKMCKLLIDGGCDVNMKDSSGDTPLLCLVKEYVDQTAEDYRMTKMRRAELCAVLSKHCDMNVKDSNGNTPLHLALRRDDGLWKLLIDRGCDLNIKDSHGDSPFHCALAWNNLSMVDCMLDRVADIDVEAKDKDGVSSLHRALTWGKRDVCARLIKRACDVNAKNKQGATPLHRAISLNSAELCQLLIDRGCDVQATNKKGQTPLEASANKPKVRQVLLECCAGDPRAKRPRLE